MAWLARPAVPSKYTSRLDFALFRWPCSWLLSPVHSPVKNLLETRATHLNTVTSDVCHVGPGLSGVRGFRSSFSRKTEPDLPAAWSVIKQPWLAYSGLKANVHVSRRMDLSAFAAVHTSSDLSRKDTCLIQLFLSATLHLWDTLPSKPCACWQHPLLLTPEPDANTLFPSMQSWAKIAWIMGAT